MNHVSWARLATAAFLLALCWAGSPRAGASMVVPGEGVSFDQVNYLWSGSTTLNSNTGEIDVNLASLQASTGLSSGYINVGTAAGWVVQNLPVYGNFGYPAISTNFSLGTTSGVPVSSLTADVEYTAAPVTSFAAGATAAFGVTSTGFNGQGFNGPVVDPNPAAPTPGVVNFNAGGLNSATIQLGHQNIQTAMNQCLPAAVANSLQWLKVLPPGQANVPGLRGNPPNSAVGQLDLTMNRAATSRAVGDPVGAMAGLTGKLQYLANNNINGLVVKHEGMLGGGNVTAGGMTSTGQGTTVTASFILNELAAGEDVELGYLYPGGGHFVEVVGGGTILGVPWIAYMSDHLQTDQDPMDTMGTGLVDFSFLGAPNANGYLPLLNEKGVPTGAFVMTESIPEPSSLILASVGIVGLGLWARRRSAA